MRVLFLGGTGLISSACADLAAARGIELWLLNRGSTRTVPAPEGARTVLGDVRDEQRLREVVREVRPDVVVQWVAYTPEQVARDLRAVDGVGQYVFISSASAYEKPPSHWLVREDATALRNPYWQYSRDKIACEEAVRAGDVPWTVVRPSLTYGPSQIPVCVGSWDRPWTIVDRMRRGRPILVPGDGTALWTVTHNSDFARGFVPLLGLDAALGLDVHVTSEEALTWDAIYTTLADAAGAEVELLHVPSDALVAADPEQEGSLLGDKIHSTVFDLTRLRSLVPSFAPQVPFAEGIRETVAWFEAEPVRRQVDRELDAHWDRLASVYQRALAEAAQLAR